MNAGQDPYKNADVYNLGTGIAGAACHRRTHGGKLLGHQQCQALAAAGGGQRPGFTLLVTQPESATAADGFRYSSANFYGFAPAPTKDSRPETKRRPLSADDLKAIFSTSVFAGCATYKGWREQGKMLLANHRFWVPLLALVTGSRLEEIGQLLVGDVRKEDDILFMDITEGATCKTPPRNRLNF